MKDGEKWIELVNKLEKSEGSKILKMIRHLHISKYTLDKNFEDLIKIIYSYEIDLSIWSVENRKKLDDFQMEFLRLLHNYISSAYSLREHTRNFNEELGNSKFNSFYNKERDNLRNDEIIAFRKDLRSYTQHYKLPITQVSLKFTRNKKGKGGSSEQKLFLNKKNLISWKGWGRLSKQYLKKQHENIDIKKFLLEHQHKVTSFYKRLSGKVSLIYKKEFQECSKLEKEIFKLQEKN